MSAPLKPDGLANPSQRAGSNWHASLTWRRGLALILAFGLWSAVVAPLLPAYARLVTPVASGLLWLLQPHGLSIDLTIAFPDVTWQLGGMPASLSRVPFRLVAYNSVLFVALDTVWPGLTVTRRAAVAAAGLALLFGFHVADLCLIVESRLLTHLRPQSYRLSQGIDLWFLSVKYYHSFSVLALKQVLPFFLVWGLSQAARRWWPPPSGPAGKGLAQSRPSQQGDRNAADH